MAVYSHDAEADVWDCELSDDDESSLFSSLPPKQPQRNVVPAISTAPAPAQAAAPEASDSLANGTPSAGTELQQSGATASSTSSQTDLLVASGNTKQRRLKLTKGDQISWKFRETSGHRVDFSVFFVRVGMGPGDEVKVKPLSRCDADTGAYVAKGTGELVLMFDNQFSWWTDKLLDFEVTRVRTKDGESGSPSGAGGQAGLHVGAAGVSVRPAAADGKAAEAEAGGAKSEPQGTPRNGESDQTRAAQAASGKRDETQAEKAKRLWEAEAEEARARWRQQEADSSDDDNEEGEEEERDAQDHNDHEEDQGTDEDENDAEEQEQEGKEPLRDKAWALTMIEKGKATETAGDQAAAVGLFESASAALDALGESRPKLVARIERLRKQLAEAEAVKSADRDDPAEFQYAAQI